MADATQESAASVELEVQPAVDGRYRIALRHPDKKHPNAAWFSWRRTYRYDPDVHPDGYDPLKAARADLKAATAEFPGHDARVEVLVAKGDDNHAWEVV